MTTGLIICGALAREVLAIVKKYDWDAEVAAVSAMDHVYPDRIGPDVEKRILQLRDKYERLIVVFGDCGSRGELDRVLNKYDIPRLQGPHCYDWFGGKAGFHDLMEEEPGTFFLTDYIVRTFRGMIMKGMGLDRYPQLKEEYFRNYKRLVYLVQRPDQKLIERAKAISSYFDLPLEIRATGYNGLETQLLEMMR